MHRIHLTSETLRKLWRSIGSIISLKLIWFFKFILCLIGLREIGLIQFSFTHLTCLSIGTSISLIFLLLMDYCLIEIQTFLCACMQLINFHLICFLIIYSCIFCCLCMFFHFPLNFLFFLLHHYLLRSHAFVFVFLLLLL